MSHFYFITYLQRIGSLVAFFCAILSLPLRAQDVNFENIMKAKPLVVSGGLTANGIFSAGLPNNDSPFNYFLSGTLNFNILGTINVPVILNYSNRNISLSQGYSFNQLSFNPTYKWITAHIGTNYMTFSPYTLNGHQFVGGGLELTPTNWKIQLMGGRLLKGQFTDTTTTGPTFERMGYGYKVEYNPGKFTIGTTMFKAYDVANSIPEDKRYYQNSVINPKDNLVMGLNFSTTLFHKLQIVMDYANSVVTKDQGGEYTSSSIKSLAGIFHKNNATTESYHAFKSNINYNIAQTNTILGVGYERIDPNYTTLGGYYFVNDLENYTLMVTQNLLNNKLNISGNIGLQRDDLQNTKASKQSRFIGAMNANLRLDNGLSMGLNFSNFQSYRFVNTIYNNITRVPGQPLDSLRFSLISQTIGYNLIKQLKKTETKETTLTFNASYLNSRNKRDNTVDSTSQSHVVTSTASYNINFTKQKAAINMGVNYFGNEFYNSSLRGFGPTVAFRKTFIEKINTNLSFSALTTQSKTNDVSTSFTVMNIMLMANWSPAKGHNLNLSSSVVKNQSSTFLNGNIGYSYSF